MAESEISISGALSFAWSLLSQNWRAIWGVLALNALSWTVLFAGAFSGRQDLVIAGMLAMLVTKYPLYGAVFRLGVGQGAETRPDLKLGAQGLQWRGMELRMLGADFLVWVFTSILFLLMVVALSIVVTGVLASTGVSLLKVTTPQQLLQALGPQGQMVLETAQIGVFLILLFVTARLLLALPASALSGRIAVLRTWKLTRGAILRLLAAWFIVQLPVWVTLTVASAGVTGELTPFSPAQILSYSILSGVLAGAASTPLTAALQAYFYQALGPLPEPAPKPSKTEPR
jgi:hypothetical protein